MRFFLLCLCVFWLVVACAKQSSSLFFFEAEPPSGLKERLMAYWEARNRQDWQRAWEFERPSWRKFYSLKRYRIYLSIVNKAKLLRLGVRPGLCKEQRCCFLLEGVFATSSGPKEWRWDDCWVKEGGMWYHEIRDPLFFPPPRPKKGP